MTTEVTQIGVTGELTIEEAKDLILFCKEHNVACLRLRGFEISMFQTMLDTVVANEDPVKMLGQLTTPKDVW
jgi:hypothetical protein